METFGLLKSYMDYVEKRQDRKLVLFGAGANVPGLIASYFPLDKIEFICDNNVKKHGKTLMGLPIVSPDRLLDSAGDFVVLITMTSAFQFHEVSAQLSEMGVPYFYHAAILSLAGKTETYDSPWCNDFRAFNTYQLISENADKIAQVRTLLHDEKSKTVYDAFAAKMKYSFGDYSDICEAIFVDYFGVDIFSYGGGEVFVDGGSYDGDDTVRFYKMIGGSFKKAYCFEPDSGNYVRACENLSRAFGVNPPATTNSSEIYDGGLFKVFKMGLSNKNSGMNFNHFGTDGSRFAENGEGSVKAVRLDDTIDETKKVTLIKLDIEGAEMAALEGMANIIRRDRPKLAVCIYHKTADFWEIPLYVHALVPEYRLFVRHHWQNLFGKVLYATL
jgi:FkbM family methyltransferase